MEELSKLEKVNRLWMKSRLYELLVGELEKPIPHDDKLKNARKMLVLQRRKYEEAKGLL